MSLSGQVAVITGASSGIGAAVARNLDEAGVKLLITARRGDRLAELARTLKECECVAGDIAEPDLPQRLIDQAVETFGRCDVVLNNAGIIEVGPVESIDIERVCTMVRVNVEAAFRMAYTALRYFRSVGRGHLVNTSSILGMKVRPTAGAYAGTKYAIEALSEALRMELAGTDIQVSCVEPGLVYTELHDRWEVHPAESMNVPDALQPEDIARAVRFMLEQPAHVRIPRLLMIPGQHVI